MKTFILTLMLLFTAFDANAIVVKRLFQDIKLPTQQQIEKQSFDNIIAASTSNVLLNHAGPSSSATTTVSTFVAQPDFARNLVLTANSSTGSASSCNVAINGTDYLNDALAETFVIPTASSTAVTGLKAFKTVTSVVFPDSCEGGNYSNTWNLGVGEAIGVKRCMANAGDIMKSLLNGAKEGTEPTMTANATTVSLNTADFNGTMNGANDFVLYFMQNYGCD